MILKKFLKLRNKPKRYCWCSSIIHKILKNVCWKCQQAACWLRCVL